MELKEKYALEVGSATDVGLVRENNEDSYALDRKSGIFIVADGLGGHSGGEVASKLATDSLARLLKKYLKVASSDGVSQAIERGIQETHELILKESLSRASFMGMGTTVVLAIVTRPGTIYIANVGDSRAYLYRQGKLFLLSKDHSFVAELVDQGRIPKEEARTHQQRNVLTQVLGVDSPPRCFQDKLTLQDQDLLLLCSDGLWDMLPDERIGELIAVKASPQNICNDLVDAAKTAGGKDNITVVVVKVKA